MTVGHALTISNLPRGNVREGSRSNAVQTGARRRQFHADLVDGEGEAGGRGCMGRNGLWKASLKS